MRRIALGLASFVLAACTQPASTPGARALEAGETQVSGTVTQVEDGGYPQYTVTIQPESGEPIALYLNAESSADLGGKRPEEFAGQNAVAYYTSTEDLRLVALSGANGAAAVALEGEAPADMQTFTGRLSGAEAVTSSDLPSIVTVTGAQGATRVFEYYVLPEMISLNGQQVTASYVPGMRHEITLLHASE